MAILTFKYFDVKFCYWWLEPGTVIEILKTQEPILSYPFWLVNHICPKQRWNERVLLSFQYMINWTTEEVASRRWTRAPLEDPTRLLLCCHLPPDSISRMQAAGNIRADALNTTRGKMLRGTGRWTVAVAAGANMAVVERATKWASCKMMQIVRTRPLEGWCKGWASDLASLTVAPAAAESIPSSLRTGGKTAEQPGWLLSPGDSCRRWWERQLSFQGVSSGGERC